MLCKIIVDTLLFLISFYEKSIGFSKSEWTKDKVSITGTLNLKFE